MSGVRCSRLGSYSTQARQSAETWLHKGKTSEDLTSYFAVPKGKGDICMLHDRTMSGLNDVMRDPWSPCLPYKTSQLCGPIGLHGWHRYQRYDAPWAMQCYRCGFNPLLSKRAPSQNGSASSSGALAPLREGIQEFPPILPSKLSSLSRISYVEIQGVGPMSFDGTWWFSTCRGPHCINLTYPGWGKLEQKTITRLPMILSVM